MCGKILLENMVAPIVEKMVENRLRWFENLERRLRLTRVD